MRIPETSRACLISLVERFRPSCSDVGRVIHCLRGAEPFSPFVEDGPYNQELNGVWNNLPPEAIVFTSIPLCLGPEAELAEWGFGIFSKFCDGDRPQVGRPPKKAGRLVMAAKGGVLSIAHEPVDFDISGRTLSLRRGKAYVPELLQWKGFALESPLYNWAFVAREG